MKQELQSVNFYKLALLKGCAHSMQQTDTHSLCLQGHLPGGYITPVFDTGDVESSFNRLTIDGLFEGAKLEVIVAASDLDHAVIDDEDQSLDAYFQNPSLPFREKIAIASALPHVRMVNTKDILLHSLSGRYIWILLALYPMGECTCTLEGMRLELPKFSFTEYFPEIYQGNDFFDRYIAVFQSMFLDVERKVDDIPALLDYQTTPEKNIEYLAGWLGIDNSRQLYSSEKLRHIIQRLHIYQGKKGTKLALEKIVHLLTGIQPRIIEQFEWDDPRFSAEQKQCNNALYGESSSHFCVILNLTRTALPHDVSENDLEYVVEQYSVLGSQFKLVYLTMCSHTDTHCYLDINSALSVPEIASIDGGTFGGHITVG